MDNDPPPVQGQDSTVDASLADPSFNSSTPQAHQPPPGDTFVGTRRSARHRGGGAISRTQSVPGAINNARRESPPPYPSLNEAVSPPSPTSMAHHNQRAPSAPPPSSRLENSYTQSATIRDPRVLIGAQPDAREAAAQPAPWALPPTQRVTSNTVSATPEVSATAQQPPAGPGPSSAIRAPSSFDSSAPYAGSSSIASTAVRPGRDVPAGRLRDVVYSNNEDDFVGFLGEVSKTANRPLQRRVAKLQQQIADVQVDIDAEVDRRYAQERSQTTAQADSAMEDRVRQLEERLRTFGKRPVAVETQAAPVPQQPAPVHSAPRLMADASRTAVQPSATAAPFALNQQLADALYAAQEQLREHEEAQRRQARQTTEVQPAATQQREPQPRDAPRPTRASCRQSTRNRCRAHRCCPHDSPLSGSDASDASAECGCPRRPHDNTSGSDDEPVIAFAYRDRGPRAANLHTLKTSQREFERLMDYRYYRLHNLGSRRSSDSTIAIRKHIKSLDVTMKDYKFDGSDPVLVFDFLTRLTEEADTIGMTESQAYIALPHYLSGDAATHFRASRHGGRSGGIYNWPSAVNHFLATYATPSAIRDAIHIYRNLRQRPNESEIAFSSRVNQASYRCGNVFDEDDRMTTFVNGLSPTIRSLVARHRETPAAQHLSFTALTQFARDEGLAYRARHSSSRSSRTVRGDLLEIETVESDTPSSSRRTVTFEDEEPAATEAPAPLEEDLHYIRHVPPAPLAYSDSQAKASRPGWVQRVPIICYSCYGKGHTAPQCDLRVSDMKQIVINFEALTDEERGQVPPEAYTAAKDFLAIGERRRAARIPQPRTRPDSPLGSRSNSPSPRAASPAPSILRRPGSMPPTQSESKNL